MAAEARPGAAAGAATAFQLLDQAAAGGRARRARPSAETSGRRCAVVRAVGRSWKVVIAVRLRGRAASDRAGELGIELEELLRLADRLERGVGADDLRPERGALRRGHQAQRPDDQGQGFGPVATGGVPLAVGPAGVGLEAGRRLAIHPSGVIEQPGVLVGLACTEARASATASRTLCCWTFASARPLESAVVRRDRVAAPRRSRARPAPGAPLNR